MKIRLLGNDPIDTTIEGRPARVSGVGREQMRSYIGVFIGDAPPIQLSAFFVDAKSHSTCWHNGFTVVNEPVAESVAKMLVYLGLAEQGKDD